MKKIFAFLLAAVPFCVTAGIDFQKLVDEAAARGGGRVTVPAGVHETRAIRLKSHVELHLEKGAVLLGGTNAADYANFPADVCSIRPEGSAKVFIYAYDCEDVAITGEGTIDGNGPAFFDRTVGSWGFYPKPPVERPRMVQLVRVKGVRLEGVTFKDSPGWTMLVRLCDNVKVDGITVTADQYMINNDGIDFDGCRGVVVRRSKFKTGDDCLILRAMREAGSTDEIVCEDILFEDCDLNSRCQTIRLGCPSDDTIRNVRIKNIRATGRNGIFADYPARYLRPDDTGYMDIHDVVVDGYTGAFTGSAIQIVCEPGVNVRNVDGIVFENIDVKTAAPLRFIGNKNHEIKSVRLENAKIAGPATIVAGCAGLVFGNVVTNGIRVADGPVAAAEGSSAPLVRANRSSWETWGAKKKGVSADAPRVSIAVDTSKALGRVKPVNGVGQPPMVGALSGFPMMHYLKEAGIPYSRLHDVGGWLGGGLYVDIPNVFPDFDADENDPASYRFAFTDKLIAALVENGIEPFFRLGVTIENFWEWGLPAQRIDPPKDFAKWARICEHVMSHYLDGWADGFHYKIAYWEIWNEPDGNNIRENNCMWLGTFEDYIRLYGVTAPLLKKRFGDRVKIGGYASCGFYAGVGSSHVPAANSSPRMAYFIECSNKFLAAVRDNAWPLDFFSYHSYSDPKEALRQVRYADEHLSSYGFTPDKTERIFNEWLVHVGHWSLGTAVQSAGVAAELIGLQNGPCDVACIYDARCGTGDYAPLFNPLTYKPHKAYYAFTAFNELRKLGTAVACDVKGEGLWACAAAKGARRAVFVANDSDKPVPFAVVVDGYAPTRCRITDEKRTDEPTDVPSVMPPWSFLVTVE